MRRIRIKQRPTVKEALAKAEERAAKHERAIKGLGMLMGQLHDNPMPYSPARYELAGVTTGRTSSRRSAVAMDMASVEARVLASMRNGRQDRQGRPISLDRIARAYGASPETIERIRTRQERSRAAAFGRRRDR